ncbi:hypothetical protein RFF05_03705 [Bengtsoniella intestinalis]|uniref:hypothetical protein n=1 Tax=Bengtsoniella intestinalis TaxID=3073143 RepID=UPI00391EEB67
MPDYKSMYYHLAGRMATSIEVLEMTVQTLEGTTVALAELTEKLKQAQLVTEEMFISDDGDDAQPIF